MDQTFEQWFAEVNAIFIDSFGLGVEDFPDYLWRDAFEEGISPEEAFEEWQEMSEDAPNFD